MGKKTKVGKQRKDKFYQLAKETGYRSRAAFKLIQLNRKFEFLQRSRVLVDLCAAPGGWLQVARQHMPVSSVVVGVDIVPIKPIHNVMTFQEDITTDNCRKMLRRELKTWKADVFLHDGAANVGKNWLFDAYQQAELTLSALKLATEFLVKGGWFVTKVFRSKDYNSLMWIFQQLFKKVHSTKPQASRTESAEIFVACQSYLAPDHIDPKFLDPKFAFAEVDPEPAKAKLNLAAPEKEKRSKAEGYAEGDYTLYHPVSVSKFLETSEHVELLANCSEILLDDPEIANNALTTIEIKECCKDIKVLGRKELRLLLNWRTKLREEGKKKEESEQQDTTTENNQLELNSDDEDLKMEKQIADVQDELKHELKRKKRKVLKDRRKLRERMDLKMDIKEDNPMREHDEELFRLMAIRNKRQLAESTEVDLEKIDEIQEKKEDEPKERRKKVTFARDEKWRDEAIEGEIVESEDETDSEKNEALSDLSEDEDASEEEKDDPEEEEENPLVVDLSSDPKNRKRIRTDQWFSRDAFSNLAKDEDQDLELAENDDETKAVEAKNERNGAMDEDSDSDDENSEGSEIDTQEPNTEPASTRSVKQDKKCGFEITPKEPAPKKPKKKKIRLTPEGLALGAMMIRSRKTMRDIMDTAWNRYTNNDDNLPDWFVQDEAKHNQQRLPVTKELVEEYRLKLKEINARPIKKIIEAKSRKKKKALKRMEKARKKAEALTENEDLSEKEKNQQLRAIYKKAGAAGKDKKETTYVVSKKGLAGKRVRRPAGVKGHFKVVDPRMKKDNRKAKMEGKRSGKGQHTKKGNKKLGKNRGAKAGKKKGKQHK